MENQTPNPKEPDWESVDSSMISAFRYDESKQILEVTFQNSDTYRYLNVPAEVAEGLRQAESKGSYMQANVIDVYPNRIKRRRR
jgi:hypothetical protein